MALMYRLGIVFLSFCAINLQAVTVEGIVDLGDSPKNRRRQRHYAAAEMDAMMPPAPRIGIVYLTGDPLSGLPPKKQPLAEMRQEGLQFFPDVLPIMAGSEVSFPNLDETYHNVFSYSPAREFDLGRYKRGEKSPIIQFPHPGLVQIFCEVHEHMRANILVLETPLFTSTNPDGKFIIHDVPAGKYTLHVWQSPKNNMTFEIEIPEGENHHIDLTQK